MQTDDARSQRNWFGGKLVPRELFVALDGPGNEGGEVEGIKEVRSNLNVLLLSATSRFDQQVKDTEEDVGKAEGEINRMEKD